MRVEQAQSEPIACRGQLNMHHALVCRVAFTDDEAAALQAIEKQR
jgi:hypothetical protein